MANQTARVLAKFRAEKLKADDARKLEIIRARLAAAHTRRRKALETTVEKCKRARLRVRDHVRALRIKARAALDQEVKALRNAARNRCQLRKYRIRKAGGAVRDRERAQLKAERQLQAQLKRLAQAATMKRRKLAANSRERRQESDDYVRGNLPPELLGVFEHVKRSIKGGARTTRTEAFLEWAESHPDEVLRHQANEADAEVRRLVSEHYRIKPPRKGVKRAALLEAVPF